MHLRRIIIFIVTELGNMAAREQFMATYVHVLYFARMTVHLIVSTLLIGSQVSNNTLNSSPQMIT